MARIFGFNGLMVIRLPDPWWEDFSAVRFGAYDGVQYIDFRQLDGAPISSTISSCSLPEHDYCRLWGAGYDDRPIFPFAPPEVCAESLVAAIYAATPDDDWPDDDRPDDDERDDDLPIIDPDHCLPPLELRPRDY